MSGPGESAPVGDAPEPTEPDAGRMEAIAGETGPIAGETAPVAEGAAPVAAQAESAAAVPPAAVSAAAMPAGAVPAGAVPSQPPRPSRDRPANQGRVGGIVLIGLGIFFLVGQRVPDLGLYIPLGVGLVLLALFLAYRDYGLLVPGCIVTGVGVGIVLADRYPGDLGGGLFLISLGSGFVAIWIVGLLFRLREHHPWPLVPGVIIGTIGTTTAARDQSQAVAEAAGTIWPIVLVAAGLLLVLTAIRERSRG